MRRQSLTRDQRQIHVKLKCKIVVISDSWDPELLTSCFLLLRGTFFHVYYQLSRKWTCLFHRFMFPALLYILFEQAPKWEGSLKARAVHLITREHGAGVQCLKRNNWWEEGEIGLIKYSTLETQSATILQVCKVLTSLADDESPSRWKWNTREREILEQQSGVWGGWAPLVQYLIRRESASLSVVSTNNWVKHAPAVSMDFGHSTIYHKWFHSQLEMVGPGTKRYQTLAWKCLGGSSNRLQLMSIYGPSRICL